MRVLLWTGCLTCTRLSVWLVPTHCRSAGACIGPLARPSARLVTRDSNPTRQFRRFRRRSQLRFQQRPEHSTPCTHPLDHACHRQITPTLDPAASAPCTAKVCGRTPPNRGQQQSSGTPTLVWHVFFPAHDWVGDRRSSLARGPCRSIRSNCWAIHSSPWVRFG